MGRRVLVVDSHESVAQAVARLLGGSAWGPFSFATGITDTVGAVERDGPAVVVIDVDLAEGDGLDLVHQLRSKRTPPSVVVFTASGSPEVAVACVRAGARGFVPKDAPPHDLLAAVAAVAEGGGWMPPPILGDVMGELLEPAPPSEWEALVGTLTPREREVLDLMVAGYDRPSIARHLIVSLNTTRTHTKNILAKLGVHSSLEAVSVALRAGIRPKEIA